MIETLINIAVEAGKIAMQSDRTVTYKKDGSPVTQADLKTSDYIVSQLTQFNIPILSEEQIIEGDHHTFFIVDPIDGTRGFVNHEKVWTVNIALIKHNEPVYGVIAIPETGAVYHAVKGKGAYCDKRIHVNRNVNIQNIVCRQTNLHKTTQKMVDHLHANMKKVSSSVKGCMLAQGDAEAYIRISPVYGWDIAPMQLIITEAGGNMTDLNGNIIKYECRPQRIEGFIASNTVAHDTLLQSYEINKRD